MRRRSVFEESGASKDGNANGCPRQKKNFSEGGTFRCHRQLGQDLFAIAGGN
jgi:hypothetical protein